MSCENSTPSYGHHYLKPHSGQSVADWLRAEVQAERFESGATLTARALLLQHRAQGRRTVIDTASDALPLAAGTLDCITLQMPVWVAGPDLFPVVQQVTRALRRGGRLIICDVHLPDDDRAADYVNAFYKLRDAAYHDGYAPYLWQGMLLDAGLNVERSATLEKHTRLIDWAAGCPDATIERLQVMLAQAPPPVAEHLRPFAVGSADTLFTRAWLVMTGRKP